MKTMSLFLFVVFLPFTLSGMIIDLNPNTKVPSPYFDKLKHPLHRPGSPELLQAVAQKLSLYQKVKKEVEDFLRLCSKLKINSKSVNNIWLDLPWIPEKNFYYIMVYLDELYQEPQFQMIQKIRNLTDKFIKLFPKQTTEYEQLYKKFMTSLQSVSMLNDNFINGLLEDYKNTLMAL